MPSPAGSFAEQYLRLLQQYLRVDLLDLLYPLQGVQSYLLHLKRGQKRLCLGLLAHPGFGQNAVYLYHSALHHQGENPARSFQ